jgi:hypothetical protein
VLGGRENFRPPLLLLVEITPTSTAEGKKSFCDFEYPARSCVYHSGDMISTCVGWHEIGPNVLGPALERLGNRVEGLA